MFKKNQEHTNKLGTPPVKTGFIERWGDGHMKIFVPGLKWS